MISSGSQTTLAGTAPRTASSPITKITRPIASVTAPEITRFIGSVSSGKTIFLTKLRYSRITYGERPTASENASHGSIPARKYRTNPVRLVSAPKRVRSTTPNTKK